MKRTRRTAVALACFAVPLVVSACGTDVEPATGSSTLTIEVVNLVGAQGAQLRAELVRNVDYGQQPQVWNLLEVPVDASPFSTSQTLPQMPEGEFDLLVVAEPAKGTTTGTDQKGVGCDYTFLLGAQEQVTITIDGLNDFGDKGYGPCNASQQRG